MSEVDRAITVWDPEPGNTVFLGLLGIGVWSGLVALLDDVRGWWNLAVLLPGYSIIALICFFVTAPVRYTLTESVLTSRRRGKTETLPLTSITQIEGGYLPDVGPQIYVYGPSGGFATLNLDPLENTVLLHRLGARMVEMGRDRQVIENEKTRRALGLTSGGRRDPWTRPDEQGGTA
jgi:hypothetical protein